MKNKLTEIMKYENIDVKRRFKTIFSFDDNEVELIFQETKKFLWLNDINLEERKLDPTVPTIYLYAFNKILDEMWHNFVLFTSDYEIFCDTYLNNFVHHQPATGSNTLNESNQEESEFQEGIEVIMAYVAEKLGFETMELWYDEFPKIFPIKRLDDNFIFFKRLL